MCKTAMYVDLLDEVANIEYTCIEYTCDIAQMSLRGKDLLDARIPSTTYMGVSEMGFGNVAARYGTRITSDCGPACGASATTRTVGGGPRQVRRQQPTAHHRGRAEGRCDGVAGRAQTRQH